MLNDGDTIDGRYVVSRLINRGVMAISYEARARGTRVFSKEYLSPKPSVPWFNKFVDYQKQITAAASGSDASKFCILPSETFKSTGKVTKSGASRKTPLILYQSFPLVEGGKDLEQWLESRKSWQDRITLARVFVAAMSSLHSSGIIHGDLKPANVMLVPAASARVGYKLQLIDMDFSILASKRAPWHGHSGYVGTPGYMSPEHLDTKSAPVMASDVFTSSLILIEILAGKKLFGDLGSAEILSRISSGSLPKIKFLGSLGTNEKDLFLESSLRDAISLNPTKRPSMAELSKALVGIAASDDVPPPGKSKAPLTPPAPMPPSGSGSSPSSRSALVLTSDSSSLDIAVGQDIGSALLGQFGSDSRFCSSRQFSVAQKGGRWFLTHCPSATNHTLVNGQIPREEQQLKDGDIVSVGNASKGVSKLPLKVSLK